MNAQWFGAIDLAMREDFWSALKVLKRNLSAGDAYAIQMQDMGFSFKEGEESAATFNQCIKWLEREQQQQIARSDDEKFCPVRVFQRLSDNKIYWYHLFDSYGCQNFITDGRDVVFLCDRIIPSTFEPTNLLSPDVFVSLLAQGLFPIGDAIREHTNQTMAAHDLAHLAGFVSNPRYAKEIRRLFKGIQSASKSEPRVRLALERFDSLLSLRLYYLVEVLTEVRDKALLERLLGFRVEEEYPLRENCDTRSKIALRLHAMQPVDLAIYVQRICAQFHSIVNPLGGESRDIFNRRRKHARSTGACVSRYSAASSKFAGNSIYSLYYSTQDALEAVRSTHDNYGDTVENTYATFLTALIGTAQLSVRDWIDAALDLEPRADTKLFFYIDSMFNGEQLFWRAFCSLNYDSVA